MHKDAHRREAPFGEFIDRIVRPGAGNEAYLTAYNSARNAAALAPSTKTWASSTSSSTAARRRPTA